MQQLSLFTLEIVCKYYIHIILFNYSQNTQNLIFLVLKEISLRNYQPDLRYVIFKSISNFRLFSLATPLLYNQCTYILHLLIDSFCLLKVVYKQTTPHYKHKNGVSYLIRIRQKSFIFVLIRHNQQYLLNNVTQFNLLTPQF